MQIGISPKVLYPVALQVIALLVNFISTGEFDRVELAQVVGVALTAVVGFLVGPGEVVSEVGPASDDLLNESTDDAPTG